MKLLVGLSLVAACGGTPAKPATPSPSAAELFGFPAPVVEPWDGLADGSVALQVDGGDRARLGVAQRGTKVAMATLTFTHEGCVGDPKATLDPARYRLDASTAAIGVRFACGSEFPAGEAVETWLHLYRLDGRELREVFAGLVHVDSHQRGPGEDFVATGTVELVPGDQPFADLVIHTTTVTTPFDEAEPPTTTTRTERHVWDGAVYRLRE